jgi:hypothetical protein
MHSAELSHRKPVNSQIWERTCTAWLPCQSVWAPRWRVMYVCDEIPRTSMLKYVTSLNGLEFSVVSVRFSCWTSDTADCNCATAWALEVWFASVDDSHNCAENDAIVHLITILYELVPVFHIVTLILLIAAIRKLRRHSMTCLMQKSVRRGHLFKETLTGKRLNTQSTHIHVRAQGHS